MSKIALVYSFEESNWFSCVKIVGNLLKSYDLLENTELIPINFNEKMLATGVREIVDQIKEANVDKIVFLDHKPHPQFLIRDLLKTYPEISGELIFHVYGDFTLHFDLWMSLDKQLKGRKVKFICASDKEVKLVKKFMVSSSTFVEKLPFPVDWNEFYLKNKEVGIREQYNLDKDSKVFIYTGRLSLQKNIVELVEVFLEAHENKKIPEESYLFLAGEFDTLGFLFGDIYHHLGEYYRAYDRTISKYPEELQKKVKLLGKISNAKLLDFYNESDAFVSFSTYHDEDYGMSVAEAGACGLPLLLTDWAGFSSFLLTENCQGITSYLTPKGPNFNKEEASKKLIEMMNMTTIDRKKQSDAFKKYLSIERVSQKLGEYLRKESEEFKGFGDLMYDLGRIKNFQLRVFFNDPDKLMNKYYYKVYDVYASKNK